jgi:uncharacterized protein YcfJ
MRNALILMSACSLACGGCVAGPGGSNNAANRTIAGAAAGALLGGAGGKLAGMGVAEGAVIGAVAGGALGAAVNPQTVFHRDTRGYCYTVDAQGRVIYDYTRRC